MSGGSYDYLYARIDDAAERLSHPGNSALRRAFAVHLRLVAQAMQDVEWVDYFDSSPGSEDEAIRACLAPGAELEAARTRLQEAMREAEAVLAKAPKPRNDPKPDCPMCKGTGTVHGTGSRSDGMPCCHCRRLQP